MRVLVVLLATVALAGCLKTPGYYARADECKRLGEYEKGDETPLLTYGSNKWRACMNRLSNQGFAKELDPPPAPAGTPRRLPSDLFKPLTDLYKDNESTGSPSKPRNLGVYERSYMKGMNRVCVYQFGVTTMDGIGLCPM